MSSIQNPGVVYVDGKPFRKKLRYYSVNIPRTNVVNAQFSGQIQINPTPFPFLMQSIHIGDTSDGNAIGTQEEFLVSATDNESGYQWTDTYVPRTCFAGAREFGLQMPEEVPIRATTRVTVAIQNKAAGAVVGTATVTLRGWELWALS